MINLRSPLTVVAIAICAGYGILQESALAAPPLALKFANASEFDDSQVYVGFLSADPIDATNLANNTPIQKSQFGSEHWYTLDQLSAGINLHSFSGRIYVGYGTPWNFEYAGYEPSPISPGSPNYLKRFDKVEITYHGDPADVANTTAIDYFSIPTQLSVYHGGTAGTLVQRITSAPTATIVNALSPLTSPAGAAVISDANNKFVRVVGPSAYPPPGGLPASHYQNFDGYLTYLRDTYAPAKGGVVATIQGRFNGVGPSPVTDQTRPQDYSFTVSIDSNKNLTLAGSGTLVGDHTLVFNYNDLVNPAGIYGANPTFTLDGATLTPQNDVYGWMIGDLLAGMNIGAIGSMINVGGTEVGLMPSQQWFTLAQRFGDLQPGHADFYNAWAATMINLSGAYNFAYTDRFAHVVAPLNPAVVDTLQLTFLGDREVSIPEPTAIASVLTLGMVFLRRPSRRYQKLS